MRELLSLNISQIILIGNPLAQNAKEGKRVKDALKDIYKNRTGRNIRVDFRYADSCPFYMSETECIEHPGEISILNDIMDNL